MMLKRTIMFSAIASLAFALALPTTAAAYDWGDPNNGGEWAQDGNWVQAGYPDGQGDIANFRPNGIDITLNAHVTVGKLIHAGNYRNNLVRSFTGSGSITMDNGASEAILDGVTNKQGHYAFTMDVPLILNSNTTWYDNTRTSWTISEEISGPGKLTLNLGNDAYETPPGPYYFSLNATNSYEGGTVIASKSAWDREFGSTVRANADHALGTGDVELLARDSNTWGGSEPWPGATGKLLITSSGGTEDRIDDSAALRLNHEAWIGYTTVTLDSGVNETINELYIKGRRAPAGTYGSSDSSATGMFQSDDWFQGPGVLTVADGSPAPASLATSAGGTWGTGSIWGGTAPGYFDEASIGHAVTVDAEADARNVTFTAGSLTIDPSAEMSIQDTLDPSGGTVVINGELETANLTSTANLTLGAGSILTVSKSIVIDNALDASGVTVNLPGVHEGNSIDITPDGTYTTGAVDVKWPRNLNVSGTLNAGENVLMQWGGHLSGGGTINLTSDLKKVEVIGGPGQVQAMDGVGGTGIAPGDDGVGTLTVQGGRFELHNSGRIDSPNYYEWEIGADATDLVSVVNGTLNLQFSHFDARQTEFRILDAGGYVANPNDGLDLFTYDSNSLIEVNEIDGIIQNITADSFNTDDLVDGVGPVWTIGTLQLHHEAYGGGGGHVYLTGLSGGTVPILQWDGGTGSWFSTTQWDGGAVSANKDMVIDAENTGGTPTGPSAVTVDADFVDGGDGPAASVTLGAIGDATNDARLLLDVGVTLEVTGVTTIDTAGKLISSLQGNDTDGTAECGVVETEDLSIANADSIQVDWTEGSDATSMFGGVYTISEYTGTPLADFGESANAAGNIGGAYIKNTDYAVDINGDGSVYAVEIELHGQGVGDTDLDGVVGPADLADFGLGWSPNATDKTWAEGDFDFNGNVDPADLAAFGLAWAPNGIAFPSDSGMGVVPEPATALMLLIGMAGLLLYRKRR